MATMTLVEKYEKGLIKEGEYICNFEPDFKVTRLSTEETGFLADQDISTEMDLNFKFAGVWQGQPILLSERTTRQEVKLYGKKGYECGASTLQKIHKACYSSKMFHATGVCMTREMYKHIPCELTESEEWYWLASTYAMDDDAAYFGLWIVAENDAVEGGCTCSSRKAISESEIKPEYVIINRNGTLFVVSECSEVNHLRPAVLLPKNILINDQNWIFAPPV